METSQLIVPLLALLLGLCLGAAVAWLALRTRYLAPLAAVGAERDVLRQRVEELRRQEDDDEAVMAALAPVTSALARVERQVGVLERDRVEQFGRLGERLGEVARSTRALQQETSTLASSLNSSTTRGVWGEVQLRRLLEHAGMLPRCDFHEQAPGENARGQTVRPDVVVRLPGDKSLVVDAKAPLTAFLSAQNPEHDEARTRQLLGAHAAALRGHVETLAKKEYWTAFAPSPEMVVCFVPADAVLAAALEADPGLFDHAMSRRVVLASPATLLALLRTVAHSWQQEALTENARELLDLGRELYDRLGTLGGHVGKVGGSLRRSVEAYNAMVGALESRVFVTARRMHDLGLAHDAPEALPVLEVSPRPLTAGELLDAGTPAAPATPAVAEQVGLDPAHREGSADDGLDEGIIRRDRHFLDVATGVPPAAAGDDAASRPA